jgi:hypothetical protein
MNSIVWVGMNLIAAFLSTVNTSMSIAIHPERINIIIESVNRKLMFAKPMPTKKSHSIRCVS